MKTAALLFLFPGELKMKKLLSVLLVLTLVFSFSSFAFAEDNSMVVSASYESRVCRESYGLNRGPGVGSGDKITLLILSSVPVHVELDGEALAEAPGGNTFETSFTAGAEGDHTLTFAPQDGEPETRTFHVYSQKEVYRRQLKDAVNEVDNPGDLLLGSLLALPLSLAVPPLGVAVFAGPLISLFQIFYVIESALNIVNLLRR